MRRSASLGMTVLVMANDHALAPWHFLYFLPEPQGQGSLRPTFSPVRRCVGCAPLPEPARLAAASSRCFFCLNSFSSASMVVEGWRVGIAISRGAGGAPFN